VKPDVKAQAKKDGQQSPKIQKLVGGLEHVL